MTLLTAGPLTDPRLPATASNVCTTDARLGWRRPGGPPPNKNPGYAGVMESCPIATLTPFLSNCNKGRGGC